LAVAGNGVVMGQVVMDQQETGVPCLQGAAHWVQQVPFFSSGCETPEVSVMWIT
jgi:hypothetical protein